MRNSLFTLLCCLGSCLAFCNGLQQRLALKDVVNIIPYPGHSILFVDNKANSKLYNGSKIESLVKHQNIIYVDHEILLYFSERTIKLERFINNETTIIAKDLSSSKIHNVQRHKNNLLLAYGQDLLLIDIKNSNTKTIIENNLYNSSNIACEETCLLALGKLLLNPFNISEVLYEAEHPIEKITLNTKHGILYLSNENLWVHNNGQSKIISPAEGIIPVTPIDLKSSERYLYLLTDNEIHVLDWLSSSIEKVGTFTGIYKSSMIDHWGSLWIATSEGIWNHTPQEFEEKSYFEIIDVIDDQSLKYSIDKVNLDSEVNHLSIQSKLIYLPNKNSIETEWSLDAEIWKKFNGEIILPTSMLAIGNNDLMLRTIVDHTKVHSIVKKIKISKSRKANNLLGWILFPLIGLLSLISLISLRSSKKERESMRTEIEKIRAEAQLIQSELKNDQLKMNPHFLFNALASVNGLLAQQKIPEARKAINSFSKFLREFLYSSDDDEISLESECSLLENYLNIEKICRGNSFDYQVAMIEDELLEDSPIPNMVLQPFVENAIIHGVSKIERQGLIKVRFGIEDSFLIAEIEDNGPGFTQAKSNSQHKSMAINLIKKRLHKLGLGARKEYVVYKNLNPGLRVKVFLKKI